MLTKGNFSKRTKERFLSLCVSILTFLQKCFSSFYTRNNEALVKSMDRVKMLFLFIIQYPLRWLRAINLGLPRKVYWRNELFCSFTLRLVASGGEELQCFYNQVIDVGPFVGVVFPPLRCLEKRNELALMETADLYAEDGPTFILPALASSCLLYLYNWGETCGRPKWKCVAIFSTF